MFSPIFSSDGLSNTWLSQRYVLETAPSVGMVSGTWTFIPRTGELWGFPIAWVQLKGQLVSTSSQWPPPTLEPWIARHCGKFLKNTHSCWADLTLWHSLPNKPSILSPNATRGRSSISPSSLDVCGFLCSNPLPCPCAEERMFYSTYY